MHPRQPQLDPYIEEAWLAALEDAAIATRESLLYVFDAEASDRGFHGVHFHKGRRLHKPDADYPDLEELFDELNEADRIDAHKVVVWTRRTVEGVNAVIRHELEHARQDELGDRLRALHGIGIDVLAERARGLAGGGVLYTLLPIEMDANAAAAMFVRRRFGDERTNRLLDQGDKDSSSFRSLVGPPPLETLPERMLFFLATVPDLCESHAKRAEFADFAEVLDLYWPGAGAIWDRLTTDETLKLPR